jgi:hypothetical protein
MTWYTGMCGIMAISLLYELAYSQCVYVCVGGGGGFGSNDFMTKMQSFPMNGHYRMDVISGVGHLRSDSVVLLVLYTICCAMAGALALYYRSLETVSTLMRIDNISGRSFC